MNRKLALKVLTLLASVVSCDATPREAAGQSDQPPRATALADAIPNAMGAAISIRPQDKADAASRQASGAEGAASAADSDRDELVDLLDLIPDLRLDMRYAAKNNFVGKVIYPKSRCLLRVKVARALATAQLALKKDKLQLLVWDCYRPFSVQEQFWKLVPDRRYVAQPRRHEGRPIKGSKHNRGAAVDLSLLSLAGEFIPVPTNHDDFSKKAHIDAKGTPAAARKNASKLRAVMETAGFTGIATEWWHFDHTSWRQYDLCDQPL